MGLSALFRRVVPRSMRREGRVTSCLLFCVLLSIPLFSVYVGYSLSFYVTPARNYPDREAIANIMKVNYSYYKTHYLTISLDQVHLGTAMFQYASMYGLAKTNGFKPLIHWENPLAKIFPKLSAFKAESRNAGASWPRFRELRPMAYDHRSQKLNFHRHLTLEGLFLSWKYFDVTRRDVIRQFTFNDRLRAHAQRFLREAVSAAQARLPRGATGSDVIVVGVHVRRGALLHPTHRKHGYRAADEHYIRRAMTYMQDRYRRVVFVVCSDDKDWVTDHVTPVPGSHVAVSPYDAPELDLAILAQCNHTVMTTGAFGWWAAVLAGGSVLYYQHPVLPRSPLADEFRPEDFYPPDWTPLSSFGH